MATIGEKMTAVANAIRTKTGGTEKLTLDQMASSLNGIDNRDSSSLTASGATVIVPAGNYKTDSSKSVATATQATPSISVSSAGLITASATQTAGYVAAGTKSATKQLTVQAAQTITPGTSNKTIASGRYLTGTQTIKGDSNLKAENIKSGVSIFGVTGTVVTTNVPSFTYTGEYSTINDGGNNWRIKFLTSGQFTPTSSVLVDVFLVGGGGGGGHSNLYGNGGGGGGYTATRTGITLTAGTTYTITIGAGGASKSAGGTTSAFNFSVAGGNSISSGRNGASGGSGGGGGHHDGTGGAGGSDGSAGKNSAGIGGSGQGTTTREFGESGATLYAGGGGGGIHGGSAAGAGGAGGGGSGAKSGSIAPTAGAANTGGGGGGGNREYFAGAKGGSGIVIIRNAR